MAGIIEGKIDVALGAIVRLLKIDPDEFKFEIDDSLDPELNIIELETKLAEIGPSLVGLCSARDELKASYDDALEIVRKASSTDRAALEANFKTMMANKQILGGIEEAEKRMKAMKSIQSGLERKIRVQKLEIARRDKAVPIPAPTPAAVPPRVDVNLPTLHIGKFTGADPEAWPEWKELYSPIHEDTRLTNERKFLYLRTFVPRDSVAGQLIAGFTPAEYQNAIDLLEQNFGQDEKRIRALQHKLLGLPNCKTLEDVRVFYLEIERLCRQLASLGKDTNADFYFNSLESKLTRPMLKEMLAAKATAGAAWTTSRFRAKLKALLEAELEVSAILKSAKGEDDKAEKKGKKEGQGNKNSQNIPTVACPTVGDKPPKDGKDDSKKGDWKPKGSKKPCAFCGKMHWASECNQYPTVDSRKKRIAEMKRCIHCLAKGHESGECKNKWTCWGCGDQHPLALCPKQKPPQKSKPKEKKSGSSGSTSRRNAPPTGANATVIGERADDVGAALTTSLKATVPSFKYCLLKCAEATLFNPNKPEISVTGTVFIDPGSQKTIVSERLAKALNLGTIASERFKLRGVGPAESANTYSADLVQMAIKTSLGPMEIDLHVMPSEHFPPMIMVPISNEDAAGLEYCPLEAKYKIEVPDILIGAKYYNELEIEKIRKLASGFWLSRSILGPILDGEGQIGSVTALITHLPHLNSTLTEDADSLFAQVSRLFQQDSFYREEDEHSAQDIDNAVHQKFKSELEFDEEENRYAIRLPFKEKELALLPPNYALAKGRLLSTLRKLRANPKMLEKVKKIMLQQIEDGITESAPREANGPVHYLPWQVVYNPEKDKTRVVFDASSGSPICLNDALHQGPTILTRLDGVLLRFRVPKIVVTADLQAAFLQLKVATEHRDVTRFLWPSDPYDENSAILVYRFVRLTFGLNCSPFALGATLLHHLDKYPENNTAKLIRETCTWTIFC